MTVSDQKAFDSILSMAQNMLRLAAERAQSAVTPEMIEKELKKLAVLMEEDFDLIDREALVDELIRRSSRTVGENATLSSGEDHVPWLDAERKKGWTYWRRYSEYMETRIPWTALDALDVATDEVLSQLEDPRREGAWDRRGLVVGHVQSGKTGNYTGLICKAADAGYKIIIVLAGLHNNLRAQTQIRLDEGFLGFATIADADELPAVGVGLIDSDTSVRPNAATNRSDKGDFNTSVAAKMNVSPEQRPWLFVVKKNKTVLERLLHWIRNRVVNHVDPETGHKLVTNLPLLVIDDESDHGSVDTGEDVVDEFGNPDLEHQPKTINRLIRSVLHHFSRKAYVGYTATPFANIFIHDRGETQEHGPDLFPAAFITNLAAPSNYVGPGRVFGSASSTAHDLPLVRPLADDDFQSWMPQGHKNGYRPRWKGEDRIPDSLAEAIRCFVYACAVRKLRGQGSRHSSMLIHVTRFTSVQNVVVSQVAEYVRDLKGRYTRDIDLAALEASMGLEYETVFVPEMQRIRSALVEGEILNDFDWIDVRAVLPDILSDIRVREINGTAKDALDYAENEGTGLKVIAIGGDKLARGLTLEGLCTSYFLRTARMYDTLMQMGRWFGYRDGYLDVCRLYTSTEMVEWFGHIADAAEELRQEFDNMVAAGATPKQFGLRVKSHSVLTVTSRAKMRNARAMQLTYSGDLLQTIVFPNRKDDIAANFRATDRFIKALGPSLDLNQQHFAQGQRWNGRLWRDVPALSVISFLREYRTHPASFRIMSPLIADFIEEMNKDRELTRWTVALIGKDSGPDDKHRSVGGCSVNMLQRKRTTEHSDRYSIKTLISPRDQAIDLTETEWTAALELSRKTWRNDTDRNEGRDPPSEPRGPQIRRILGEGVKDAGVPHRRDRGLLMLYLLDPAEAGETLADADPVVAWAISFPGSTSERRVSNASYVANSVLWGGLNDWVD
ncbi:MULTISPECIES: Z1 domain-containing protein [unclassified Mesorhizobium]|uniref:Z1 domain-containing protein n=1 Tax=unclassified Mesorhizobium TaxID=325217 RepID=UPI000FDC55E0|nr:MULTISPECIES: Z1 domain-containing protein [unclassified Mesorhizobium]TGR39958.1 endonuclease [bacterium M00.F.Ca.ET.199.01.1.1]TGU24163.1 endonuclease [bacterium M00.F.Ca.ET.156.01.1.1]TGV89377.1 endonuclease [Mesorhizobium sp. M00.F.Ca.ET.149.01.1.1]TGR23335.1 endonuclease [Mesorhizobium sp. M8A.F.Ca.ET.202.01.1.1]TGR24568.1 endonuclease [Mesorhizobium sp. M8A.F.Ca.ET.197.01.1.1]